MQGNGKISNPSPKCPNAEKDISISFAYDYERSHKNEILADARMKSAKADEIFGFASDEIKSTHSPSRRISHAAGVFHIA